MTFCNTDTGSDFDYDQASPIDQFNYLQAKHALDRVRDQEAPAIVQAPAAPSFAASLAHIVECVERDPILLNRVADAIGRERLLDLLKPVRSFAPFPADPGTVEATVWDNQPFGKKVKAAGDKSRDRPSRFGVQIKATVAGNRKPLSGPKDFNATGDLFTVEQVQARLKKAWRGMPAAERKHLDAILDYAGEHGLLVARLFYAAPAGKGGGKEFFDRTYLIVEGDAGRIDPDARAFLMLEGRIVALPKFATEQSDGAAFKVATRQTKAGTRHSVAILQSRASDLDTLREPSKGKAPWITGNLVVQVSG